MQQKNVGKQIWRFFGPFVMKTVVAWIVEIVIISIYMSSYLLELQELFATQPREVYFERVTELSKGIMQYSTEIAALSALIMIPIFIKMFQKDRAEEKMRALEQQIEITKKKVPSWRYLLVIGISVPFAIGLNNILTLLRIAENSELYQKSLEVAYAPPFFIQLLCFGIISPIMEELLFRGLFYRRVREEVSMMRAILYSSVFFGLYHGNMVQMIYGILCGMLLAYLYEVYGSLKAPILAHSAMNIAICMITKVNGFHWLLQNPLYLVGVTTVCAVAASSLFVVVWRYQRRE